MRDEGIVGSSTRSTRPLVEVSGIARGGVYPQVFVLVCLMVVGVFRMAVRHNALNLSAFEGEIEESSICGNCLITVGGMDMAREALVSVQVRDAAMARLFPGTPAA